MQGARVYITVQVWVPAGLRGTCSGRSKLRNLASNRDETFRLARAKQVHGNPKLSMFHTAAVLLLMRYHSPQQASKRLDSRGTTAALQPPAFVTATNGAAACVRVCLFMYAIIGSNSSRRNRELQRQLLLPRGTPGISNSEGEPCKHAYYLLPLRL